MKRLRVIVLLLLVSSIGAAYASYQAYRQLSNLTRATMRVDAAQQEQAFLTQIAASVKDLQRYERGYLLSRDTPYFRPRIERALVTLRIATDSLQSRYPPSHALRASVVTLRADIARSVSLLRHSVNYIDSTGTISMELFNAERKTTNDILDQVETLQRRAAAALRKSIVNRTSFSTQTRNRVRVTLIGFGLLTAVLFAGLVVEVLRNQRYDRELGHELEENRNRQREIGEIAYAVNHHLQEPLRKIQVFSGRLLQPSDKALLPAGLRQDLQRLTSAAEAAQSLVADLAGFTSLSAGKVTEAKAVSLSDVLHAAIKKVEQHWPSIQAAVHVASLPIVNGNAEELTRLFSAVLDNAMKFASPLRPTDVSIASSPIDGQRFGQSGQGFYAISVTDNGIGFDNEHAETIFRLFSRLHGDGEGYQGKGLGLALARRIMVNHGGYILAYGELGVGTRITLYFPVPGRAGQTSS